MLRKSFAKVEVKKFDIGQGAWHWFVIVVDFIWITSASLALTSVRKL